LTENELADTPYYNFKTMMREHIASLIPKTRHPADKKILGTLSKVLENDTPDSELIFHKSYDVFRARS